MSAKQYYDNIDILLNDNGKALYKNDGFDEILIESYIKNDKICIECNKNIVENTYWENDFGDYMHINCADKELTYNICLDNYISQEFDRDIILDDDMADIDIWKLVKGNQV